MRMSEITRLTLIDNINSGVVHLCSEIKLSKVERSRGHRTRIGDKCQEGPATIRTNLYFNWHEKGNVVSQ